MKFPIFMDNHSTTPMDPRVLDVMLPYFIEKFGNAASRNHQFGWEAEEGAENARKQIAKVFHCDATQGVGKIPVDVNQLAVDLMSFSSHKIYGPKGVGALYVRKKGPRVRLVPQIDGGGHERGMRSGTLPVPLIVGFGKAAELCDQEMPAESKRIAAMRNRLQAQIMGALDECYLNGHPTERLPHNLNISFAYVE